MNHAILRSAAVLSLMLSGCSIAQPGSAPPDALQPFPAAQAGMTRWAIEVPSAPDEHALQLELQIGRTMEADCNQTWITGKLVSRTVQGWGYDYLMLETNGQVGSTRMGCPANSSRPRFVPVRADGLQQRYNSRLPLVVYVPSGYEVRYRIWRADTHVQNAQKR